MADIYKHLDGEKALATLQQYCQQLGLDVSCDALEGCLDHLDLMLTANEHLNLTRITEQHDALILHILDSLVLLPYLNDAPRGRFLDLGTGGGYPGIPLALASGRKAVLLDSIGKKVQAVNGFITDMGMSGVSAVNDRAESYAVDHRSSCAAVVARAVAPLAVLLEYASPLLMRDGLLIVSKGQPQQDEIDSAARASRLCGFDQGSVAHIALPEDMGERSIFVYRKCGKPQVSLPRPVGMAKKKPLA